MDKNRKYDPEDLEHLMLNKSFDQLLPEEKQFVEQHVDSADEYESMRAMLLEIIEISEERTGIKPNPAIRKRLIKQFKAENSKRTIWWQSLNPFEGDMSWGKALIPIAAVAIIAFFILNPLLNGDIEKGKVAERIEKSVEQNKINQSEMDDQEVSIDSNAADSENKDSIEQELADLNEFENDLEKNSISKDIPAPITLDENEEDSFNDAELSDGNNTAVSKHFAQSTDAAAAANSFNQSETVVLMESKERINTATEAGNYSALLKDLYTSY